MQAGSPTALNWAIHAVRKGGTSRSSACTARPANLVPIGTAMNKGLTLRMNQCNVKRYMPRLIEHIRAGRIDPKAIITHRLPLEEVAEAYDMFAGRRTTASSPCCPAVGARLAAQQGDIMQTDLSEKVSRGATGRPEAADADPAARPGVPMYKPAGTSAPIARPPLDQQEARCRS